MTPGRSDDPELLSAWAQAVRDACAPDRADGQASPEQQIEAAGRELLSRWADPRRRYHDVAHLAAVLSAASALADDLGAAGVPATVRLAAWFHDAVYEGRPGADEEASAVLVQEMLPGLGVPADVVTEVARLVRLTSTHDPDDGDADGALLVDADLAVLAGNPVDYRRYTEAVRAEYSFVPEDLFRSGRAAVLSALLDTPSLYRTGPGRARWEAAARANVTAEIAVLRGVAAQ